MGVKAGVCCCWRVRELWGVQKSKVATRVLRICPLRTSSHAHTYLYIGVAGTESTPKRLFPTKGFAASGDAFYRHHKGVEAFLWTLTPLWWML